MTKEVRMTKPEKRARFVKFRASLDFFVRRLGILMSIDPWILAFSAATIIATIWMGFWSAKKSKTAHDFFVAGRSVSVGWNASAISGEYLSAASFMGVAGMVMSSGYDALGIRSVTPVATCSSSCLSRAIAAFRRLHHS
jgi:Na+/pantothenate symporter